MVTLSTFTDVLGDEIENSQPLSLPSTVSESENDFRRNFVSSFPLISRPAKGTGQNGEFRSVEEIDPKYKHIFSYPYFNLVQSRVIEDALYTDKSIVVCAPTGSGKTVIFEMAIVQLLMEIDDNQWDGDFKIIYMAPVKSLCTERLTEWYPKFTKLGHLCIEVTGDTDVDFQRLKPYKIIITTPEKWDMLTRRWKDHRGLVELIKLFLIDEVHILNDETRGPVLEAVVSRMKTVQESAQSAFRLEQLTRQYQSNDSQSSAITDTQKALGNRRQKNLAPKIRFVAVSATISNPEDVADWLGSTEKRAVYHKFGDESRPVKIRRIVEGYPCTEGTSIFKFDIILNYKLWPVIQKYNDGKPTLIFCNTRKSVTMTAETLSRELTVTFSPEQKARLVTLASTIKNKKLQSLVLSGVGCHHAGLLYEERVNIENSFRNRELPILITTTTLAMGVNLPAHLVIIKNTQQYVNGAYQEYSLCTVLQMVGRAGRPQYDTEATAVIMTTLKDKPRYQSLVGGSEPLQSYLHKRIAENLNSEAALSTVTDVAQCVQWLRSTFLYVRAGKDPRRYLGLPNNAPAHQITKKIEELCVKAMNGLATSGLITMDEASCIKSTEAGRLMSVYYLDLETMKLIMKINGTETLDQLLLLVCESHELSDNHLRTDERRILNSLNRNTKAATIRFPMKGKITTRQMKLSCIIQAMLGCLQIPEPSLHQEGMKIMRIAERVCKCLLAYVTRPDLTSNFPKFFTAILNAIILNKCIYSHLWENSPYVSKQLKGIGPTFSTLLATAGKSSFMLLEESHPRDLERIMNRGPPAGNIIRKQIALLPKYQLTATPIDSNTVCFKLLLLNHAFMSENIDNLTAGVNHKSFIIIGDSDNHLLLLTSFKDKDLIGMYDGSISHEITRQNDNEQKIQCHCISTIYVGIDVQCEYVFKKIEKLFQNDFALYPPFEGNLPETPKLIQPSISDIFKERKRKNNVDITHSKEKKKRDSALIEKIKQLKDNFGATSKDFRKKINENTELSSSLIQEFNNNSSTFQISSDVHNSLNEKNNNRELAAFTDLTLTYPNTEDIDFDCDDTVCDDEFNNILNNIEQEIYRKSINNPKQIVRNDKNCLQQKIKQGNKTRTLVTTKSNFKFIDKIDSKNSMLETEIDTSPGGLPDSIKTYIAKYLKNQTHDKSHDDNTLTELIDNKEKVKDQCISNSTSLISNTVAVPQLNIEASNFQYNDKKNENVNLLSNIQPRKPSILNSTVKLIQPNCIKNDDEECENVVLINDLSPRKSANDDDDYNKATNDLNIIEINDESEDDMTQLLTQKVLSLSPSPEKNIKIHNELHDNYEPEKISPDNESTEIHDLPEIKFIDNTLSEQNNKEREETILTSSPDYKSMEIHDLLDNTLSVRDHKEPENTVLTSRPNNKSIKINDLPEIKLLDDQSMETNNVPEFQFLDNTITENNNKEQRKTHFNSSPNDESTEINDLQKIKILDNTHPENKNKEPEKTLFTSRSNNKCLEIYNIPQNKVLNKYLSIPKKSHELLDTSNEQTFLTNVLKTLSEEDTFNQNNSHFNRCEDFLQDNNLSLNSDVKVHTNTSSSERSQNNPIERDVANVENKIINKFTYSHTDINVSNKELPDRKIRIVKKVRIDLDVTEIISKPVPKSAAFGTQNIKEVRQCPSKLNCKCVDIKGNDILAIQKATKNEKPTIQTPLLKINFNECSKTKEMSQNSNSNNISQSDEVVNNVIVEQPRYNEKIGIGNAQNEKIGQTNKSVYKCIEGTNQQTSKKDCIKPQQELSISNVLQKYSELLQCKSDKNSTTLEKCMRNIPGKEIQQEIKQNILHKQSKRSYKISDIQNDRIPLPESFSQIIKPHFQHIDNSTAKEMPQYTEIAVKNNINNTITNKTPNNFYEAEQSLYRNQNPSPEIPTIPESRENNDVNDLKSPFINKLQLSNVYDDFNIEPAMLDPKTLLQSINQDCLTDLIIPPPPDFSGDQFTNNLHDPAMDEIPLQLLKYDNYQENGLSDVFDCDKGDDNPESINAEQSSNIYFNPDSLIKEKNNPDINSENLNEYNDIQNINHKMLYEVDLTPTREVETWSLSHEDSPQVPHQSIKPKFTILQNLSRSQPEHTFQRLQSFKFKKRSQMKSNDGHHGRRPIFKRTRPSVERSNFHF